MRILDRKINAYAGALAITVIGAGAAMLIMDIAESPHLVWGDSAVNPEIGSALPATRP